MKKKLNFIEKANNLGAISSFRQSLSQKPILISIFFEMSSNNGSIWGAVFVFLENKWLKFASEASDEVSELQKFPSFGGVDSKILIFEDGLVYKQTLFNLNYLI